VSFVAGACGAEEPYSCILNLVPKRVLQDLGEMLPEDWYNYKYTVLALLNLEFLVLNLHL
jgi:hypothetical protein